MQIYINIDYENVFYVENESQKDNLGIETTVSLPFVWIKENNIVLPKSCYSVAGFWS